MDERNSGSDETLNFWSLWFVFTAIDKLSEVFSLKILELGLVTRPIRTSS